MYEVDLIGGPEDGNAYMFPDTPPYLYFPYIPEPVTMLAGPDDLMEIFKAPKLVYKHVLNGLYIFQGVQE